MKSAATRGAVPSSMLKEGGFGTVEDIDRSERGPAMAKERTSKKARRC
jgi:hypothetical protein